MSSSKLNNLADGTHFVSLGGGQPKLVFFSGIYNRGSRVTMETILPIGNWSHDSFTMLYS